MGKIKHFEKKDYVINSDNGKKYRILESEFIYFQKYFNINIYEQYYSITNFKENLENSLDLKNIIFRYDDESFTNGIKVEFEIFLYDGENYITYSEYLENINKYFGKEILVYLFNERYNYFYQIGMINYTSGNYLTEKFIFDVNYFILDFSKYVLGMNDGEGNYENFEWE